MRLVRSDDPQRFYERVAPFLLADEAAHNLILGLSAALIRDPDRFEDPYLAWVEDDGGQVAAACLMTLPRGPVLSLISDPDAVALLAHDLRTVTPTLPGVNGPVDAARAFAEAWQTLSGQPFDVHLQMRTYRLEAVTAVEGVAGQMRPAANADRELLIEWVMAFAAEATDANTREEAERIVDLYLSPASAGLRGYVIWEDGGPVSMAGFTGPTPHGIRVMAVYTPPALRGRGYASACVAALSQQLLDEGRTFCFLFTDLANPTSNHIYQQSATSRCAT